MRISPWARRAMSDEVSAIADRLHLQIIATNPSGPFVVRHPKLTDRRGGNVDALVLAAARELEATDA